MVPLTKYTTVMEDDCHHTKVGKCPITITSCYSILSILPVVSCKGIKYITYILRLNTLYFLAKWDKHYLCLISHVYPDILDPRTFMWDGLEHGEIVITTRSQPLKSEDQKQAVHRLLCSSNTHCKWGLHWCNTIRAAFYSTEIRFLFHLLVFSLCGCKHSNCTLYGF